MTRQHVEVSGVDEWLRKYNVRLTQKSVIKIDVETHEPEVFRGAKGTLEIGPAVFCEVLATFTEQELNALFTPDRWRYFWIGPEGPVERRTIAGDPSWQGTNYLFLTKDSPFLPFVTEQ